MHGGDPNWGRLVAAAGRSGAAFVARRARRSGSGRSSCSATACRTTNARTRRPSISKAPDIDRRGRPRHRRQRHASHDVDVRFQRRVRADQRGVPDMSTRLEALEARQRMVLRRTDARRRTSCRCSTSATTSSSACLDLAARLKAARAARPPHARPLEGQHVALLFEKPSLRTRSTFQIAVRELGGDVIEPPPDVALGGREIVEDVARNLERWVYGAVVRTFAQARLEAFAAAAPRLRVVNALTDEEHPCQALADCLTLQERLGQLCAAARSRSSATATTSPRRWRRRRRCSACTCASRRRRVRAARRASRDASRASRVRRRDSTVTNDPVEAVARRRRRLHGRLDVDGPGSRRPDARAGRSRRIR